LIEQCATLTYCCFSSCGNWKDTDIFAWLPKSWDLVADH
jgi:hypothetical protein